ncbi:F0F1 ATP synthase subunit A [Nocardia terpenica]|nr:F0F1 ATP synthase subunit A [Nocardia terpenica]MBF6060392.1 F0F1 ATP synthase subunit A [Nocardia terpenica]MBF6103652.1 F0F1 ATP synthase subunit A [Nocardia terpenica]MBF6111974.1 F0F1 ATP synthase subunit A [Nocardia terpenica]MBF6117873.1 F0F1 ATP synthase subunit A [Nocardia terpenica]MBF6155401.1 F0F1 ATP synthase subunit A [Nocardia terpenica]
MTSSAASTPLAASIEVGEHAVAHLWGLDFNVDTIVSTAVAAVIVLALAVFLRIKITSGVPNGVQLFFEAVTVQMRNQVEAAIGMKVAPFALPLAVTLFTFILLSNWLSVLPVQYGHGELIAPPASDVNFVYALALFVFIFYQSAGIARRGPFNHVKKMLKGHTGWGPMIFINIIEEIAKPLSLSLRLFGNMFAGGVMISVITLFPFWISWGPNAIWKMFDLFVGAIQAFIFSLLTVLYFSQSMELEHENH